jgi:hypothetical protein
MDARLSEGGGADEHAAKGAATEGKTAGAAETKAPPKAGTLAVTVQKASGLADKDTFNKSDPYCTLVQGNSKFKTKVRVRVRARARACVRVRVRVRHCSSNARQ